MRYLDTVRQCSTCATISEEENAKLRQLKRLQVATEFHNRQEKRTAIAIDEHLTVMILKTVHAEPVELLLRNVEFANILTKDFNDAKIPIGFKIGTKSNSFEMLLPEEASKEARVWLKDLLILFAFIFKK